MYIYIYIYIYKLFSTFICIIVYIYIYIYMCVCVCVCVCVCMYVRVGPRMKKHIYLLLFFLPLGIVFFSLWLARPPLFSSIQITSPYSIIVSYFRKRPPKQARPWIIIGNIACRRKTFRTTWPRGRRNECRWRRNGFCFPRTEKMGVGWVGFDLHT